MKKNKRISKPRNVKHASRFLESEQEPDSQEVPHMFKKKKSPQVQVGPHRSEYHHKILELKKEDFRRFGMRIQWTEDEDDLLIKLREVDRMGWVEMEKYFPGRTDEACKMRYKKLQNKTQKRWNKQERDELVGLVKKYGTDWPTIALKFSTQKTAGQIKTYYEKTLPKRGFTAEQHVKLIECLKKYELLPNIWEAVAQEFPGRRPAVIREHYDKTLTRIARKKMKNLKFEKDDLSFSEEV